MKKCERLTKYLCEHNIEEDPEMVTQAIHILEFMKKDLEEHASYQKITIISLGEAINHLEQYDPDEEDFMDDLTKDIFQDRKQEDFNEYKRNEVSPEETDEEDVDDEDE